MAPRLIRRVTSFCAGFRDGNSGSIAVLFAVTLFVLFGVVGIAVDFGRAHSLRSRLQQAADAAALAAAKDPSITDAEVDKIANSLIAANSKSPSVISSMINRVGGAIRM